MIHFRPITITTMAALMGTLQTAFGTGIGADARRRLGIWSKDAAAGKIRQRSGQFLSFDFRP